MREHRTVLEQKINERRQTFDEFVEFAEMFAREHHEPGTLSVRHLQRLTAGCGPKGQPLGPLRPATARLLERIFDLSVDELLARPPSRTSAEIVAPTGAVAANQRSARPVDVRATRRGDDAEPADRARANLAPAFGWLDQNAGWLPATSQRKVMSRLAKLNADALIDQRTRRARMSRRRIVHALSEYYADAIPDHHTYRAWCGDRQIITSILTRPDWVDLACALTPETDRLRLTRAASDDQAARLDHVAGHAVRRLVEAAALDVRFVNVPIYRLLSIDATPDAITGTVGLAQFVEYALTVDLLETELIDAVASDSNLRFNGLPLRDRFLPNLASVVDIGNRLCVGGALALCAIARSPDPYRGAADYAILVQERSAQVLNAVGRLSVIPKSFHQPLKDVRADAHIGATLRREMEAELFGRHEVDSTAGRQPAAAPMHPSRLSEPMRWLMESPDRLRMECTGFGFNLVSGNYEFASLIVIDDDEFWTRYGGQVEANWESSGLRVYSSLDGEMIADLACEDSWSNEGLFALLQGLRRLVDLGGNRVNLPPIATF